MTADRIVGGVALIVAAVLYWLGSSAGSPEAYLFPRLISGGMGLLAIALLVSTRVRPARSRPAVPPSIPWRTLIPALLVFVAYLWAMETVGFYAAGFAAFLIIVSVYAPCRSSPKAIMKRVAISALFIGIIYSVFALLLRVQTPRGLLI